MRLGTWNVRSLYGTCSLTAAAARELARYKLVLVGVQEVRWDKGGTVIVFSMEKKKNENNQLGTGIFVHHRIVSAVKQSFIYSPTDALVSCLKNNIKIYIKTAPTCFSVTVTPTSGSALIYAY